MKAAIIQPYLFPYIGYYQLYHYCDKFIFFDDVNFVKKRFINRNQIIVSNAKYLFTLPIKNASQNKKINSLTALVDSFNLLDLFQHNYKKSNNYKKIYKLVSNVIESDTNFSIIAQNSINNVAEHIGIYKKTICSSEIDYDKGLSKEDKIIEICKKTGCDTYVNLIGGKDLYDYNYFKNNDIKLQFLESNIPEYSQSPISEDFIPYLSIIDMLMFLNPEKIKLLMNEYKIRF